MGCTSLSAAVYRRAATHMHDAGCVRGRPLAAYRPLLGRGKSDTFTKKELVLVRKAREWEGGGSPLPIQAIWLDLNTDMANPTVRLRANATKRPREARVGRTDGCSRRGPGMEEKLPLAGGMITRPGPPDGHVHPPERQLRAPEEPRSGTTHISYIMNR